MNTCSNCKQEIREEKKLTIDDAVSVKWFGKHQKVVATKVINRFYEGGYRYARKGQTMVSIPVIEVEDRANA